MPRKKLTDEERAKRKEAQREKDRERYAANRAAEEAQKVEIRDEIALMAGVIPPHVRDGAVQTVRTWKDALDAAVSASDLTRISVERLAAARDALRDQVQRG